MGTFLVIVAAGAVFALLYLIGRHAGRGTAREPDHRGAYIGSGTFFAGHGGSGFSGGECGGSGGDGGGGC